MYRLHMRATLISSLLLFFRIIVPVVHGQISRPEWPTGDKATNLLKIGEEGADWPESGQGQGASSFGRDLVDPPSNNVNAMFEHTQPANMDKYLLLKNQKYLPQVIIPQRMGYGAAFNRQQRSNILQSGPAIDYPSDEVAQKQLDSDYYPYPTSPYVENYIPSLLSMKARVKPKEMGGPRYLVFSNFKRARDGYLCHFKLCQVGVSGKRLSM